MTAAWQRRWPIVVVHSDLLLPSEESPTVRLGEHARRANGTTDDRECNPRRNNGESHRSIERLGDLARRSLRKQQQLLCEARASAHASCGRRAAIGANKAEQIFE